MQLGESIAMTVQLQKDKKCILCDADHPKPKQEQIKPVAPGNSGWHRKPMSGVFESDGVRETIYASGFKPSYKYQGHHCIALSAFVDKASSAGRTDRRVRLNHFLDKVGFFPNRPRNCIGLPARRSLGDFKAFWQSVDQNAPLQMHGPGHDEVYFTRCESLLGYMILLLQSICEAGTKNDWEQELKQLIEWAENHAFKKLAHYDTGWQLHPTEQMIATRLYSAKKTTTAQVVGTDRTVTKRGYGKPRKNISYPSLPLNGGPF